MPFLFIFVDIGPRSRANLRPFHICPSNNVLSMARPAPIPQPGALLCPCSRLPGCNVCTLQYCTILQYFPSKVTLQYVVCAFPTRHSTVYPTAPNNLDPTPAPLQIRIYYISDPLPDPQTVDPRFPNFPFLQYTCTIHVYPTTLAALPATCNALSDRAIYTVPASNLLSPSHPASSIASFNAPATHAPSLRTAPTQNAQTALSNCATPRRKSSPILR